MGSANRLMVRLKEKPVGALNIQKNNRLRQ